MDVKETDKEIVVEAELPGIDDKDISLSLQDGVLTIRGEKKLARDEEKENYRMMERRATAASNAQCGSPIRSTKTRLRPASTTAF
jgi:HSP20 family molecular chaperone IbpA